MQAKAEETIAKLKEAVDRHIHKEVVYCSFISEVSVLLLILQLYIYFLNRSIEGNHGKK